MSALESLSSDFVSESKTDGLAVEEEVSLSSLSKLTGFPVDFIKKELALENDTLSMKELRKSMLVFLQSTINQ